MKVLVTGATGFLGSTLVRALLKEGHEVLILKRSTSNVYRIVDLLPQIVAYDVDQIDLAKPFTDHGPIEVVIHTATSYGRNYEAASEILDANLHFPVKLVETAVACGTTMFFNTDTSLPRNINLYALSKKQFVEWGEVFASRNNMQFINLVLEHFYGPGDDATKFTSYVFESCLRNIPELKLTAGEQKRDFIYFEDVVAAYLLLLDKMSQGSHGFYVFQLGSGEVVTIRHFVETVHKLTQSETVLLFGAIEYRENEVMESKADTTALNSLGWSPQITLTRGILATIRRMRA